MSATIFQQPRPFYMIFMLEIWERFGFYTVQGIIVVYFIRMLGFSDTLAYETFGAFFALVYGLVAIGGYIGDELLGTKRTILLGLWVLVVGYLALALLPTAHVFYALGLIAVGNGIFKANPSSLLSKCYQDQSSVKLHSAFTLYYMAINFGAIAALFIGPAVASRYGYAYAFILSGFGIILGLLNYAVQRSSIAHINNLADKHALSRFKWCGVILAVGLLAFTAAFLLHHVLLTQNLLLIIVTGLVFIYGYLTYREKRRMRLRMLLALILMAEAIVFFTLYQQMATSINLFAVNNVYPTLMGLPIDPQSFQVLNPIWIIIMSPLMARFYNHLHLKKINFTIPYKFAFGMFLCGLSFIVLYLAHYTADNQGMVSSLWLVGSYALQGTSELLISALGVAMVAELVPKRMVGFVMGLWYSTSAIAGFTGAKVASLTALPQPLAKGVVSLNIYTHAFAAIGVAVIVVAIGLCLLSPKLERLMRAN